MKFIQLIECSLGNTFLQKSCRKLNPGLLCYKKALDEVKASGLVRKWSSGQVVLNLDIQ